MMSKQKLQHEANTTGFRAELLEKVFVLMRLLNEFSSFPQLKDKFVLKGGTALNVFCFNLPRLSVDIDLNYIGNIGREDIKKRLIPLLKKNYASEIPSVMIWSDNLLKNCQEAFHHLLRINNQEKEFLSALLDKGVIEPQLISSDSILINNINHHPAIQWRAQNIRKEIL